MSLPAGAGAVTGPATHAFPITTIGSSSQATLTFAAQSAPTEVVQSVLLAGPQSASFQVQDDRCTGQAVAGTCAVTVAFAPTSVGSAGATLRVVGDAGTQEVALTATGSLTGARLVAAPAAIDFGDVHPGTVATRALSVTNTGDVPVSIDSVGVAGAQASAFAVEADACGGHTLAPGDGCSLVVRFVSVVAGARTAQVHLSLDGAPAIDVAVRASLVQLYGAAPGLAPSYLPDQTWASFKLTKVSGKHRQIKLRLYTSLSAHVRLTVARKGSVVASLKRDLYPGSTALRVPRLRTGRYAIKAVGARMREVRMAHASVTVTR
jgi:hypothetical protein